MSERELMLLAEHILALLKQSPKVIINNVVVRGNKNCLQRGKNKQKGLIHKV